MPVQRCTTLRGGEGGPISTDSQDAEALARIRDGDRDAYAGLVRRYARVAVRTASLLGAGADAEDVAQEAFAKAYATLDRFREGAPFRPWLLRIVANETRNLHRGKGRRAARERLAWAAGEPLLPAPDDPSSAVLSAERREQLVRALRGLPPGQRQVVICRFLLDLDESETATVLGLARGTVKSRTHRGLRRLSDVLEPLAREVDRGR